MTRIYTANIADTVMFRNLGKDPSPRLQSLKSAVEEAGTEIWVPAAVYHELADTGGGDQPTNPYLDTAIEEGWVRVATPLSGDRTDDFDSTAGAVEKARFVADAFLNQQSKYPETNNWRDAALVALAVRLFDQNARFFWQQRVPVSLPNSATMMSSPDIITHHRQRKLSSQLLTGLRGMGQSRLRDVYEIS